MTNPAPAFDTPRAGTTEAGAASSPSIGRPDDHVVVLFGATGDLASRKLLPGLFHLAVAGLLPERWRIVGTATRRSALSDRIFRDRARAAGDRFAIVKATDETWSAFEERLSFAAVDPADPSP